MVTQLWAEILVKVVQVNKLTNFTSHSCQTVEIIGQLSLPWSPGTLQDSTKIFAGCLKGAGIVSSQCDPSVGVKNSEVPQKEFDALKSQLYWALVTKIHNKTFSGRKPHPLEDASVIIHALTISIRESPQHSSFLHVTGLIDNCLF